MWIFSKKRTLLLIVLTLIICVTAGKAMHAMKAHGSHIIFDRDIGRAEEITGGQGEYVYSAEWKQAAGYNSFKVFVNNTSDDTITLKITSAWGYEKIEDIPPKESITVINNNAHNVRYKISFISKSENMKGDFAIREAAYNFKTINESI